MEQPNKFEQASTMIKNFCKNGANNLTQTLAFLKLLTSTESEETGLSVAAAIVAKRRANNIPRILCALMMSTQTMISQMADTESFDTIIDILSPEEGRGLIEFINLNTIEHLSSIARLLLCLSFAPLNDAQKNRLKRMVLQSIEPRIRPTIGFKSEVPNILFLYFAITMQRLNIRAYTTFIPKPGTMDIICLWLKFNFLVAPEGFTTTAERLYTLFTRMEEDWNQHLMLTLCLAPGTFLNKFFKDSDLVDKSGLHFSDPTHYQWLSEQLSPGELSTNFFLARCANQERRFFPALAS